MRFAVLALLAAPIGCSKVVPDAERPGTSEAADRLKWVGACLRRHEDMAGVFPTGTALGPNQLGLSWRVQLLPYLGEEELYRQFNFREAWDSPHNMALVGRMPERYATPGSAAPPGHTHLRSFVAVGGPHAAFLTAPGQSEVIGPGILPFHGRRRASVTDGLTTTLMVVEAAEPVVWTKPEGLEYDPAKDLPKLGVRPGGFLGCTADGRVHWLPDTLPPQAIRLMITINDGQNLPRPVQELLGSGWKDYRDN